MPTTGVVPAGAGAVSRRPVERKPAGKVDHSVDPPVVTADIGEAGGLPGEQGALSRTAAPPPLILPGLGRDGVVNFGGVAAVVLPRGLQIVTGEAGKILHELLVGPALVSQFDEGPDGDAPVADDKGKGDKYIYRSP